MLKSLQFLHLFNLSYNKLHGEVPKEGIFLNSSTVSLVENPNLCGGIPDFNLPKCATTENHLKRSKHKRIIGRERFDSILRIIMGFGLLFLLKTTRGKRDDKQESGNAISTKVVPELYSLNKLKAATNNFNSENMIGEGSFGSIFKGILGDGSVVAIEVFKMNRHEATKSFLTECEALRNVRHGNLVRILSACSTDDFKPLVLKSMQNGSLEKWLHNQIGSRGQERRCLNLQQRLDVAIDVASALEYLHYESGAPTLHYDIKLDEDISLGADLQLADWGPVPPVTRKK